MASNRERTEIRMCDGIQTHAHIRPDGENRGAPIWRAFWTDSQRTDERTPYWAWTIDDVEMQMEDQGFAHRCTCGKEAF